MAKAKRGRPRLDWLDPTDIGGLQPGVVVAIEHRRGTRTIGRVAQATDISLELHTQGGETTVNATDVRRLRIVPHLYEPGDPVLLRGVPAAKWRGGVVRTEGTEVLVEQLDGTFAWHPEAKLEPAEARDEPLPAAPRGPIPARR